MSTPPPPKKRLAIVGGGMGGVATAWFCDSEWEVDLFEAKDRLGGNCASERVPERHADPRVRDLVVDLGAQFFHPETHPTYIALLELLGVPVLPQRSGARAAQRFEIPASLSVFPLGRAAPPSEAYFASSRAMRTPVHALEFVVYAQAARKMAARGDYDVTIAEWVDELPVGQRFKTQILLPWVTASEGHPLAETQRSSARAILQLFAPSHPRTPLERPTTWSSTVGFQGHVEALAARCQHLTVHASSPVDRVEKNEAGWFVWSGAPRENDAPSGPFDAVVINAPPWEGKKLLHGVPWAEKLVGVLDRFEHMSHRLTIHADPTYMHPDRRNWALANIGIDRGNSELSIWMGAALDRVHGKQLDLFKSWTTYRSERPKEVLFERTFDHSIKTPAMIAAARQLETLQGQENLWFAGQFTSGIDLQERALRSAMDVGRALCRATPNLNALERQHRERSAARSAAWR